MSKSEKSSSESPEQDQPSKKRPSEDPKRSERPQSSNMLFYLVIFGVIALVGFTLMGDSRDREELDRSYGVPKKQDISSC